MAYQAFYNKYRPQTFDEVVGQKAIVTTLKNAIAEDKIAHAYLFCGPRGTGKTTMARLFAKALNCKEGLGHQCNKCDSCIGIMKGEQPDVFEIDAASNSTVDSVRQLIDNVSYQPVMSRYKVYIIDEVHNMSNSAFNALLKTLEEPPSFVVFILATTEPQKILPTILSRVQRFDFSKVSQDDLVTNMERVLDNEHITYEKEALRIIAELADGGVRDSLSLLDKLVSYSGENLTVEDVNHMLGLLSRKEEISLVNAIASKDADKVLLAVRDQYNKGADILRLHDDLIGIYKDFILYATTKDASLLEKLSEDQVREINLSLNEARGAIDTLIRARREYRFSDDLLSHFELTLISLMSPSITTVAPAESSIVKLSQDSKDNRKQNVLLTKPTIVKGKDQEGFVSSASTEKKDADETIQYSKEELINILLYGKKAERQDIQKKWSNLEKYNFTEGKSFEAKAMESCKVVAVTDSCIILTSPYPTEINKLNKKAVQPKLMSMMEECFGKAYHVLPILDSEFAEAASVFRSGTLPEKREIKIDFGEDNKANASTDFFNDLMQK